MRIFQLTRFYLFAEETFDGSGSGSGDGTDEDPITDDEDGFDEGSGYKGKPTAPEPPKKLPPTVLEPLPPRVDIEPKTTSKSNKTSTTSLDNSINNNNSAARRKMSLPRAMATYLLPIAVVWFGGCLTEWL